MVNQAYFSVLTCWCLPTSHLFARFPNGCSCIYSPCSSGFLITVWESFRNCTGHFPSLAGLWPGNLFVHCQDLHLCLAPLLAPHPADVRTCVALEPSTYSLLPKESTPQMLWSLNFSFNASTWLVVKVLRRIYTIGFISDNHRVSVSWPAWQFWICVVCN